ncbi:MAG: hypothetical protein ABR969_10285 [Sedimentisphaerales bacterium]
MNTFFVLAETTRSAHQQIISMDMFWEQVVKLGWLQALIAVSFGAVYLIYGWRIFKVLAVVSFGMGGLFIGMELGRRMGTGPTAVMWGGVAGLIIMAVLSIPLMHWAVSILGAAAGGIITSCIWYALGLPHQYILAGAVIGIVAGGMISFIVFKISVMLFTSLGGAVLIITGLLALANLYEHNQTEKADFVYSLVNEYTWFMPAILIFTTFVGMVIQNKLVKGASDWKL